MDISVLPNNNHPEKFLQLDVGMLPATHGMFQVGSAISSQRHWQNRVYSQREHGTKRESRTPPSSEGVVFVDRYLEKHITPVTLKSNIKRNPLYTDLASMDTKDNEKPRPSWTVREYDTHTTHGHLADYLKMQEEEKTPKDMNFWLEDLYTPGFDSLLKKTEAKDRRKKKCKIVLSILFSLSVILIVIVVPVVVLQGK